MTTEEELNEAIKLSKTLSAGFKDAPADIQAYITTEALHGGIPTVRKWLKFKRQAAGRPQ
jgi:hypothetical protein